MGALSCGPGNHRPCETDTVVVIVIITTDTVAWGSSHPGAWARTQACLALEVKLSALPRSHRSIGRLGRGKTGCGRAAGGGRERSVVGLAACSVSKDRVGLCTVLEPLLCAAGPGELSSGHRVREQCPRMRRQERFPHLHGGTRSERRFLVGKTRKFSSHRSSGGRVPEARCPGGSQCMLGGTSGLVPLRPISVVRASQRKRVQRPHFLQLCDLGQGGQPLYLALCLSLEWAKTPCCRWLREELLTAPEEAQLGGPVLL